MADDRVTAILSLHEEIRREHGEIEFRLAELQGKIDAMRSDDPCTMFTSEMVQARYVSGFQAGKRFLALYPSGSEA